MTTPQPFDVRFTFANATQHLWANKTILKQASAYFKTLFESEFREGKRLTAAEHGSAKPVGPGSSSDAQPTCEHKFHSIEVADHSIDTYRAVLTWIMTGQITFAPLGQPKLATAALNASMSSVASTSTPADSIARPPAVSPTEIYRLAHLLELSDLEAIALTSFVSELTPANVAHELFSPAADLYDEIRAAAVDFVVARWDEVEQTEGMKAVQAKVEAGEFEHGGVGLMALTWAFAAKTRGR